MPKVDFSKYDEADGFTPIPDGQYEVEVDKVEERSTHGGDEMWGLRLKITKGEYENRFIFDNMVFSANAMKRVKLICSRMGFDVSGEVDLKPDMLLGRRCIVETEIEDYEDDNGKVKKQNKIPFAGYYRIEDDGKAKPESKTTDPAPEEEDLPF